MTQLYICLTGCCLAHYCLAFHKGRYRLSYAYIALGYSIVALLIRWGMPDSPAFAYILLRQCLLLCCIAAIYCIACQVHRHERNLVLFVSASFLCLAELGLCLGICTFQIQEVVAQLLTRAVYAGYLTDSVWTPRLFRLSAALSLALAYSCALVVLHLSTRQVVYLYTGQAEPSGIQAPADGTQLAFLLLPAISGLFLSTLLRLILVRITDEGETEILFERIPSLRLLIPAILFVCLASLLATVSLFQRLQAYYAERSRRMAIEQQIQGLQESLSEMERVNAGLRQLRHDMGNTTAILSRLALDTEDRSALQDYLASLGQTLQHLSCPYHTGNAVVDAVLTVKSHEAEQRLPGLQIEMDGLHLDTDICVGSYDLGVILGNALDNALEASVRLRERNPTAEVFIRLYAKTQHGLLLLRVENRFDPDTLTLRTMPISAFTPALDPDQVGSVFPRTHKRGAHGLGLSSIQNIVQQYDGTMDYRAADGLFTLSVMLQIEKRPGSENIN